MFKQLFDKESSTYTYNLGSKKGNALIIDTVKENIETYQRLLKELNLNLSLSLETHTHADHISGSGMLNKIHNSKILSSLDKKDPRAHQIKDNELISLDELNIRCLHTPGHTDDSYCFLLESVNPNLLFSGDTLLIGGTGRSDFQNGCPSTLFESITQKIFTLEGETLVYPGHDYNGLKVSSIYQEIEHNPRLANKSKEEFVEIMGGLNLSAPKIIDVAVPLNRNFGMADKE